jgi:RNA polymerase sigma-70 factor (ECF subfamily)
MPTPLPATRTATDAASRDASAWTDEELLGRALAGAEVAWRELLRRFRALIHGCIARLTSRHRAILSPCDADEIYAEVLVALLADDRRRLRAFDPCRGVRLSSWLAVLTSRLAIDYARARAARPLPCRGEEPPEVEDEALSPLDELLEVERRRTVSTALRACSERDRAFLLLYAGGCEVVEIADRLNISVATVYSRKHKLLARLQASLRPAA